MLIFSLFFSALCITMPTYYDFHGGSSRGETLVFAGIFFMVFNALFCYFFYNIKSAFWWRKYVISLANLVMTGLLIFMGLQQSNDIPTFGAMLFMLIIGLPVLILVEVVDLIWQKFLK